MQVESVVDRPETSSKKLNKNEIMSGLLRAENFYPDHRVSFSKNRQIQKADTQHSLGKHSAGWDILLYTLDN